MSGEEVFPRIWPMRDPRDQPARVSQAGAWTWLQPMGCGDTQRFNSSSLAMKVHTDASCDEHQRRDFGPRSTHKSCMSKRSLPCLRNAACVVGISQPENPASQAEFFAPSSNALAAVGFLEQGRSSKSDDPGSHTSASVTESIARILAEKA